MNAARHINRFVYGTQYYRAPTPLPVEWEHDLQSMDQAGLDTIQLRIQWRWNEPREGEYCFDDIDRLFGLAAKHSRQVIFKFLMECAPDYIFYKYQGHRRDVSGNILNPGACGAFFVGGWIPCFDNPSVVSHARRFVQTFVERYRTHNHLLLWNIWNEPRARPIGECACEHSVKAYQSWLRQEYKSVDQLNDFFGKRWEAFETIRPPAMPMDYAELFLWRKWSLHAVRQRLEFMCRIVRGLDANRPIISHVGACSVLQDIAGDGSDDLQNAGVVDFYGTSLPCEPRLTNLMEESQPMMVCDWLRSVSERFWVYELYPDWGDWHPTVSLEDFKFKVWLSIACGCKGLMYWQYRAERLGNENNLAGLVNIDGSFKEVTRESARIGQILKENETFFVNARVYEDPVAILYSRDSDLINRVENTGGDTQWSFDLKGGYPYLYKKALLGAYALFRELGYSIRWVDTRQLPERLDGIRLLYVPECFILSDDDMQHLERFVHQGGRLLVEEGIGLRQSNTWLQSRWPATRIANLFAGVRIMERVSTERTTDQLTLHGITLPASGFVSYCDCGHATAIGHWQDGRVGAVQAAAGWYLGTSVSAGFYEHHRTHRSQYLGILSKLLTSCGIHPRHAHAIPGLYVRELIGDGDSLQIFFNRTASPQIFVLPENGAAGTLLTDATLSKRADKRPMLMIPPHEVALYLQRNEPRRDSSCKHPDTPNTSNSHLVLEDA